MSDEALRRVERALAAEPQSVEHRRRHAQILRRAGQETESLDALDLAWRLGADDVWDELAQRLQDRRRTFGETELCYVPGGPFVMGSERYDQDAGPPHLVELSSFYVTRNPVRYADLDAWEGYPEHWRRPDYADYAKTWRAQSFRVSAFRRIEVLLEYFNSTLKPKGLPGSYRLCTEAQWERVFRAAYLRPEGESAYGVLREPDKHPEWVRDQYESTYYSRSPRRDPVATVEGDAVSRVVRGVAEAPDPQFAVFREAAREDGHFPVKRMLVGHRWLPYEGGLAFRFVYTPEP